MEEKYVSVKGVYYPAAISEIKKARHEHLQPIYEAFTNSLESLKKKNLVNPEDQNSTIKIDFFYRSGTVGNLDFDQAIVEDTGIGFDDENYDRAVMLRDNRKGFHNKGTGRIQFLHFFETSKYFSVFKTGDEYKQRTFTLSKHYLDKNAIISNHKLGDSGEKNCRTALTFDRLLDEKDQQYYNNLTAEDLKGQIINRYMMHFCSIDVLPQIKITHYVDGVVSESLTIDKSDIPSADKEEKLVLNYFKPTADGKDLEPSGNKDELILTAFKIPEQDLEKNEIKLTSKGEIIKETKITLESLAPKDKLNSQRYLFLISGDYIDDRDNDTRGSVNIPTRPQFIKDISEEQEMFPEESILLDDIERKANSTILFLYDEIKEKKKEKESSIRELSKMFLLNKETVNALSFSLDEPEEKILEKVYAADSKTIAKKDARIKKCIDALGELDATEPGYKSKFSDIIDELVLAIPNQNRAALTHYVARRKLVLDLFGKILDRELLVQKNGGRNFDEKLLHNLIFQQSSKNPDESDLWLINEDFIYFRGASEERLCDVEIDGRKVFKQEFSAEEQKILNATGEDRTKKRPDVLLFPDEGKCIIIEFKNTDVNVSSHLNQINRYATLLRNFSNQPYFFNTFYGYLIGESIDAIDVQSHDSDFLNAYNFDYLFRPYKRIIDYNDKHHGSLYTEVIKYSTLLDRAKKRNEIFINKLTEQQTTE